MNPLFMQFAQCAAIGQIIGIQGADLIIGQEFYRAMQAEFSGFCQDNGLFGTFSHAAGGFGPHEVIGHKTELVESVCPHKEFAYIKILYTVSDHGANHYLRFFLIFPA